MDRGTGRLQSMGSQRVRHNRETLTFHEMNSAFWWLSVKESACNAGDTEIHSNPLQCSCLENLRQRSLAGYSPWGCKESDTSELTEHITHEINHQVVCKHSSGLILRLHLCAPECPGLSHLRDEEYFQTMHNSKEYHSLSSPEKTVLSHRAWLPRQKGFKSLTSSQPVTTSFLEVAEK